MQASKVILILAAAFAVRLALLAAAWQDRGRLSAPDTAAYVQLADQLGQSGEFTRVPGATEIFRTPGYPVFLMIAKGWGESWWRIDLLLQIVLDVVSVWMTIRLGLALCGDRVGLWAGALYAVHPVVIASSVRLLSDTTFVFLFLLAMLLIVRHLKTGRFLPAAAFALTASLGCYVRPSGLAFLALAAAVLIFRGLATWARRGEGRSPRPLVHALAACAIAAAAILPWVVRNGLAGDYWGFSSVAAEAAFDYQAPAVLAEKEGIPLTGARQEMLDQLAKAKLPPTATPGQIARAKLACGLKVLQANPALYASIHARGDLAVWAPAATDVLEILGVTAGGRGTLEVLRRRGMVEAARNYFGGRMWALWICAPMVLVQVIAYLLAIVGLLRCLRPRMGAALWLAFLTAVLLAALPGPAGHPRFQAPIVPLLGLAAGAGAIWIESRMLKRT